MCTQKHFPRAILSVLLVCCLLTSLVVPASAATVEELSNDISNLTTACQTCRTQSDDVLERSETLAALLNSLASRLDALDGQATSPIDTAVPAAEDVSGVSAYVAQNPTLLKALYEQCEALQVFHSNCCAQQRRIKPFLQNCNSFIISLAARLDTLDGQSTDVAAFSCSNGDYTPNSSSSSSLLVLLENDVYNLKLATAACKKMNDEELAGLEAMETTFTALEARTTALDGGSGSSKLPAPTVTLSGDRLSISFSGDESVTTFAIYVDGELSTTVYRTGSITDFALSDLGLSYGDYQITVAGGKAQTILTETSNPVSYSYAANIQAGQWVAKESLLVVPVGAPAAWPSDLSSTDISFRSGGVTFSRMSVGSKLGSSARYLFYDDTPVYCYGDGVDPAGWVNEAYAYVYLSADVCCVDPFYSWFTSSYLRDGDTEITQTYKTTVNVYSADGSTLLWFSAVSASWLSPAGTVSITDTGLTFTCGGSVYTYEHTPADGYSLHGFSVIVGGSTLHLPGASISVGGAPSDLEYNFYAVEQIVVADKEYKAGILGWFERLWDAIAGLPKKFAEALVPSWLSNIFSDTGRAGGIGATVSEFFSTAWDRVTSLFGLTDLWDDPTGPFAWLKE